MHNTIFMLLRHAHTCYSIVTLLAAFAFINYACADTGTDSTKADIQFTAVSNAVCSMLSDNGVAGGQPTYEQIERLIQAVNMASGGGGGGGGVTADWVQSYVTGYVASAMSFIPKDVASKKWTSSYVSNAAPTTLESSHFIASYVETSGVVNAAISKELQVSDDMRTADGVMSKYYRDSLVTERYTNEALLAHVPTNMYASGRLILAPVSSYWTNAVIDASIITSDVNAVSFCISNNVEYYNVNACLRCCVLTDEHGHGNKTITVHKTRVSDDSIKTARGEE